MTEALELCLWRLKRPYYEQKKSRWRKQYVKKQLESGNRRLLRLAAALLLTAELLYGTVWIYQKPEAFLHTLRIQVLKETGENQGWNIRTEGTCWGIRIRQDGIEVYQEENRPLEKKGDYHYER